MPARNPLSRSTATDRSESRLGRLLASAGTIERILWILVAVAMLADVTLTVYGRQLGLVESNPVARGVLSDVGVIGLVGLKGVALGIGGCCRLLVTDRYGAVVPIGLAVPSLAAVGVNTAVITYVLV